MTQRSSHSRSSTSRTRPASATSRCPPALSERAAAASTAAPRPPLARSTGWPPLSRCCPASTRRAPSAAASTSPACRASRPPCPACCPARGRTSAAPTYCCHARPRTRTRCCCPAPPSRPTAGTRAASRTGAPTAGAPGRTSPHPRPGPCRCAATYGVRPSATAADVAYGGRDVAASGSRIVFTNGELDPWGAAGLGVAPADVAGAAEPCCRRDPHTARPRPRAPRALSPRPSMCRRPWQGRRRRATWWRCGCAARRTTSTSARPTRPTRPTCALRARPCCGAWASGPRRGGGRRCERAA